MFKKLLIANRGEIACRVIRTATRLGIATVAVYSDADADALHVAMADEAHRIGPAPARQSYLDSTAILAAATRAGADSLHPGYGFLSENADFADACAAAGITFVGPPPSAIRAMGGKSEAKALMEKAGVPLVPGYHGAAQDEATLTQAATQIGYPVLIKASAGGGGKGMRVVERPEDLAAGLATARREAKSAFGDDRVLIEKYLTAPRHIEIQVFADTHGNCVHLFERDCSIQRRHQKIIEEAPAPGLTPAQREAMGQAAIGAARAVNYVGAGTVEFIAEGDQFHFMEMNTRLQVEHPVTEAITGQDLVEWQLRVAAGEPLPKRQDELTIDGHAIEVRLYAEDPAKRFLPSVGTITHLRFPDHTRIDAGIREGDTITPHYDPMIAKLITHGATRTEALHRLSAALTKTEIVGVRTNLALLAAIATHPEFAAGNFDTGFIDRHPELFPPASAPPPQAIAAAALTALAVRRISTDPNSPWETTDAWRPNLPGAETLTLRYAGTDLAIRASGQTLEWSGRSHVAALAHGKLRFNDTTIPLAVVSQPPQITIVLNGINHGFELIDPLAPPQGSAADGGRIIAPMPGRIISVLVKETDTVTRGQPLVVMEAMKMEMTLAAPANGVITAVRCAIGDMVQEGVDLVDLE